MYSISSIMCIQPCAYMWLALQPILEMLLPSFHEHSLLRSRRLHTKILKISGGKKHGKIVYNSLYASNQERDIYDICMYPSMRKYFIEHAMQYIVQYCIILYLCVCEHNGKKIAAVPVIIVQVLCWTMKHCPSKQLSQSQSSVSHEEEL